MLFFLKKLVTKNCLCTLSKDKFITVFINSIFIFYEVKSRLDRVMKTV